jgi:hypothetical protein
VSQIPAVVAGGAAQDMYLSFSLFNSVDGVDKGFEAILNPADSAALLDRLLAALSANKAAVKIISDIRCKTGLLPPGQATDVSPNTSVTTSGVRLNRNTGRYVGTVTVKNNSATSIPGPISLVLNFQGNVQLFDYDGLTCATSPSGLSFINLPINNNVLLSGGSVVAKIEFLNPNQELIKFTTKVLSGPGAR